MVAIIITFFAVCPCAVSSYPRNCLYAEDSSKCLEHLHNANGMDRYFLTGPDPAKCNDGSVAG